MRFVHSRCAGLDVHKKSVSACIRIRQGRKTIIETAVFGTFTRDLERLRDWLSAHNVQQVAMESTGCSGFRCGTYSNAPKRIDL